MALDQNYTEGIAARDFLRFFFRKAGLVHARRSYGKTKPKLMWEWVRGLRIIHMRTCEQMPRSNGSSSAARTCIRVRFVASRQQPPPAGLGRRASPTRSRFPLQYALSICLSVLPGYVLLSTVHDLHRHERVDGGHYPPPPCCSVELFALDNLQFHCRIVMPIRISVLVIWTLHTSLFSC